MTRIEELNYLKENCPLYINGTSKREVRHNFFKEIKTELQAYLLGFIMSDGTINDERHTLIIHINDKDAEIFKYFKMISPNAYTQELSGTESLATIRGKTVKNKSSIRLSIASKILIEDLHKLGVVERKTYQELHIPVMPEELIRHFFRGYFDGDGCFTYYAHEPNKANREVNWTIRTSIQIDAKTSTLLIEFQKWLAEKYEISMNINYIKRDQMYRLCTASKKVTNTLYHILYDNSIFRLSRKYNKFNHYVNTEVTQLIAEYRNAQEVNVNESNNPPKSTEHSINQNENVR